MVGKPSMRAAVARVSSADCGCRVVSEMFNSSRRRVASPSGLTEPTHEDLHRLGRSDVRHFLRCRGCPFKPQTFLTGAQTPAITTDRGEKEAPEPGLSGWAIQPIAGRSGATATTGELISIRTSAYS
jgi:hypothetical protein